VNLWLGSSLEIQPTADAKPKRFGFELHVDEDYMAAPDPRVALTGEITQGGLVRGVVPPDTKVWFEKEKVMVSPEGDFVFGFGRDAEPRALLSFAFAGGPTERHVVHVTDRVFEPEVIDGLPPEMVEPDRETRQALAKSRTKVAKLRRKASEVAYFREGFRWPAKGRVTSTYGRKRVLDGEDHDYHWGVDLALGVGSKVRAPAGGVVVLAEKDVPLSGNLLIVDHGHGVTSSFLHLQKFKVKEGDVVKAGQVIALSGNSGRSTGPHLDWRMNWFDTRVDPQTAVPPRP
jgi:murein DD-endopeptidase MepM/ murein hydrolase activator NlpD